MIHIISLGYGDKDLTLEAVERIKNAQRIIVKTNKYKAYKYFTKNNIEVVTLDDIYCSVSDYDALNTEIANRVVALANETTGDTCYCVGGSATGDKSVDGLIKLLGQNGVAHNVVAGVSYAERAISKTLGYVGEVVSMSATDLMSLRSFNPPRQCALVISEVYDRYVASEIKLKLMTFIGEETNTILVTGTKILPTKLCDVDQILHFTYDATLVIPPIELVKKERYNFNDLIDIVLRLRDPDGCKWDRAQTHKTIRANAIEEAYELVEAIDEDDIDMMLEESGDVILQGVFHAVIGEGMGEFDHNDMMTVLCKKLITRHTHIFGEHIANTEDEALSFWDKAKSKEKNYESYTDRIDSIAKTLPELTKSLKTQKAAKKCGFDWDNLDGVYDKILEEIEEVKTANGEEIEKECGDLLFAVVNLLRKLNIDPELALASANKKFRNRFFEMEKIAKDDNKTLEQYNIDELEELWKKAKKVYK